MKTTATTRKPAAAVPPAYAHRPGFESPKAFTRLLIGMGFVANPDEPKKSKKAAPAAPAPAKKPLKPHTTGKAAMKAAKASVKPSRRPSPAEVAAANAAARKAALAPKGRR